MDVVVEEEVEKRFFRTAGSGPAGDETEVMEEEVKEKEVVERVLRTAGSGLAGWRSRRGGVGGGGRGGSQDSRVRTCWGERGTRFSGSW